MLTFSPQNAKTKKTAKKRFARKYLKNGRKLYSLDLLSGWSCPFAKDCKSKAVKTKNGLRIKDGPDCLFRCYAASQEAQYPALYNARKRNFDKIRKARTKRNILRLLKRSLPKNAGIIRLHAGGEFFSQSYFDAVLELAQSRPDILFYGYTKGLSYWKNRKNKIPPNLVLTASYGGILDFMIPQEGFRSCTVVRSTYEARKRGLPVDTDDSHAANPSANSFAIVIHGTQPKGSELARIVHNRRVK